MSDRFGKIIVIGNEKGGSGKSTTAMHLAVGMMQRGLSVSTIDVDGRQGTLSRYMTNRESFNVKLGRDYPTPDHHKVDGYAYDGLRDEEANLAADRLKWLIEASAMKSDVLIIDTPGAANRLNFLAHTYADTLITPINDSFIDLDVVAHMEGHQGLSIKGPSHYAETIWEAKKQKAARDGGQMDWVVIRNRMSNLDAYNKREMGIALKDLSQRLGFRVLPGFSERVIFRELFLVGLTILDLKQAAGGAPLSRSHIAAREEIMALVDAIAPVVAQQKATG